MTAAELALVIPAFNRAHLIADTLQSALSQEIPFSSIVVVDDGSSDDTAAVVARFGAAVRLIRTSNQGVQMARNVGAASCDAQLIAFCDSDDLLCPEFSSRVAEEFLLHPALDILYCNFQNFSVDKVWPDKFSQAPPGWFDGFSRTGAMLTGCANLYEKTLGFQPLFPTGMVVRRDFFRRCGGFDTRMRGVGAEDWEFTLRAISQGNVGLLPSVLARIRRHDQNDSTDQAYMLRGEATILQHALACHNLNATQHAQVRSEAGRRLRAAMDCLFAQGDFEGVQAVAQSAVAQPLGPRLRAKLAISRLPGGLGQYVWRCSQGITARLNRGGRE